MHSGMLATLAMRDMLGLAGPGAMIVEAGGDGCYRNASEASDASGVRQAVATIDATQCDVEARRLATRVDRQAAHDGRMRNRAACGECCKTVHLCWGRGFEPQPRGERLLGVICGGPCQQAVEALAWALPFLTLGLIDLVVRAFRCRQHSTRVATARLLPLPATMPKQAAPPCLNPPVVLLSKMQQNGGALAAGGGRGETTPQTIMDGACRSRGSLFHGSRRALFKW